MIGPNGVGKTTFLKSICALLVPDNDEIKIDDLVLNRSTRTIFLRHIGSVFIQSDSIFDLSINDLLVEHYYFFNIKMPKNWNMLLKKVSFVPLYVL